MIQSRYYLIDTPAPYEPIRVMGNETSPFVTSEEWATYIAEYTNNIYGSEDKIIMRPPALRILADMLEEKIFGREGLNHLIAWSLYTQLVFHTQPDHFPGRKDVLRGCYAHVAKVMKLALVSPYLHAIVTPDLFEHGKKLAAKLVETFRATLASSKWLNGTAREVALRKIDKMKLHIGSPGNRLDPAMVEKFYEPLPDVPVPPQKGATNLFSSWIKARSLSARALWLDQATFLFDEGDVNAFHLTYYNAIIIPAAILTRPFLISTLTDPLNYGALGSTLGHEIMHGFDVSGTKVNDENVPMRWSTPEFLEEYTKRTLCLRQAHKSVVKATARQEVVNDTLDSENLADFIGVRVAHAALQSLPQPQRSMTLAGLNITAERLFFINYCTQRCSEGSEPDDRYAPARSRCIVPLMNMPEFSSAFGCAAGEPMNPPDKCTFW
ncbi:hypothetical protein HPB49_010623 [Dermacentor silvarum]|uniref:Uncharacterized protein n=1 Tax=Dermacentor silvarum TaxID=543639 RepID=A0ACB8D4T1_DERSI|nr:hypothetical protein HPB49_010623 [Dermacentor silvarum]